jgi:hypothetical protein
MNRPSRWHRAEEALACILLVLALLITLFF